MSTEIIHITPRVEIGKEIPELTFSVFQNNDEKTVTFAEYRGKWLAVVFYPADFTFVCPTELEELAGLYPEFQKEGAEIVSVSTDTIFVHKAWHDNSEAIKKVNYGMAADPTGKLSRTFGVYIEEEGLARRGTFLIDPTGVLRTIEIHDNSIGRSGNELLRKLRAAKFVAEHGGNVCPASWEPGEATLKPGLDLVGKI